MFPSAIIKKDKKKLKGAEKVPGTKLEGIEEMMPKEKYETSEELETYSPKMEKLEGAKKVPMSKVPSANKPKSEDLISIDLAMQSAKKKKTPKEANSYEKDMGYFKTPKGTPSEKYLEILKKKKAAK